MMKEKCFSGLNDQYFPQSDSRSGVLKDRLTQTRSVHRPSTDNARHIPCLATACFIDPPSRSFGKQELPNRVGIVDTWS